MVFQGLLTKGRPLEARHEKKNSMGSPEDCGFDGKTFNFTLRDICQPLFSRFQKPMKYFAKMLGY